MSLKLKVPALYNACLRQGLMGPMRYLDGTENEIERVRALYQCRVRGYSVLYTAGKLLVNGHEVAEQDLDNLAALLKTLST